MICPGQALPKIFKFNLQCAKCNQEISPQSLCLFILLCLIRVFESNIKKYQGQLWETMNGGSHYASQCSDSQNTHNYLPQQRAEKRTGHRGRKPVGFLIACSFVCRSALEKAVIHFITGFQEGYSWERSINFVFHLVANNLAETCWLRYRKYALKWCLSILFIYLFSHFPLTTSHEILTPQIYCVFILCVMVCAWVGKGISRHEAK